MVCYIQKDIFNYNITSHIINNFSPDIIEINHYKDIFNRSRQNFNYQKSKNVLILAKKDKNFLYKGSKFCNSRGYENFYYSTQILGCLYNCEYCYLGGVFPSGYSVIFVNEDDFIASAEKLKNAFVPISYETDLLAYEGIYPFHKKWIDLARRREDLLIESRTKSANVDKLPDNPPKNFILTFSLNPSEIVKFEKKTPSLEKRIKAIQKAISKGYRIELAIDPIIKTPNFYQIYRNFITYLKDNLDLKHIPIEIGAFRLNADYLKKLRKTHLSEIVYYPFKIENKTAKYEDEEKIVNFVKSLL